MKLKDLNEQRLNLTNTQKAVIVYMHTAATKEMAYSILTGARNAGTARDALERTGYIIANDERKTASLTQRGVEILTSENLVDDTDTVTDRGKELIDRYIQDRDEWKQYD